MLHIQPSSPHHRKCEEPTEFCRKFSRIAVRVDSRLIPKKINISFSILQIMITAERPGQDSVEDFGKASTRPNCRKGNLKPNDHLKVDGKVLIRQCLSSMLICSSA
jgi:hypothetical protein